MAAAGRDGHEGFQAVAVHGSTVNNPSAREGERGGAGDRGGGTVDVWGGGERRQGAGHRNVRCEHGDGGGGFHGVAALEQGWLQAGASPGQVEAALAGATNVCVLYNSNDVLTHMIASEEAAEVLAALSQQ
jgi:hypothetical protein